MDLDVAAIKWSADRGTPARRVHPYNSGSVTANGTLGTRVGSPESCILGHQRLRRLRPEPSIGSRFVASYNCLVTSTM